MSKDKAKKSEAEGEAAAEGAEGEAPAKKKPPLMILIAGGVGALVVLGGGGAAAFMMLGHKAPEDAAHAKKEKPKKKEGDKKEGGKDAKSPITEGPDGVFFYAMQDQVANMQSTDGRPTLIKLKLSFELPDKDTGEAIDENAPRLNDMFQSFLRELRQEDVQGSQGSYQLRAELQRRVNLVIAPAKVNSVLIQEMLVQ